jgi:hypothetical protein
MALAVVAALVAGLLIRQNIRQLTLAILVLVASNAFAEIKPDYICILTDKEQYDSAIWPVSETHYVVQVMPLKQKEGLLYPTTEIANSTDEDTAKQSLADFRKSGFCL